MHEANSRLAGTETTAPRRKGRRARAEDNLTARWVQANWAMAAALGDEEEASEASGGISDIEFEASGTVATDLAGAVMRIRIAERRLTEEWTTRPDQYDAATEVAIDLLRSALAFFGPDEGAAAMKAGCGEWLVKKTGGGWDPRFGEDPSRPGAPR